MDGAPFNTVNMHVFAFAEYLSFPCINNDHLTSFGRDSRGALRGLGACTSIGCACGYAIEDGYGATRSFS